MSYFQEQQAAFLGRQIPGPNVQLPPTPPSTPPAGLNKSVYINMSESSSTSSSTNQPKPMQRHVYAAQPTPGIMPPVSTSPFSLPPLLRDDSDEESPASTAAVTPRSSSPPSHHDALRIVADHSMLHQMSLGATPENLDDGSFPRKPSYPLLPPHHPLRSHNGKVVDLDYSPPHTPKGHPVSSSRTSIFNPQKKIYAILNPYSEKKQSYTTTFSRLLRVPRKYRPLGILVFCVFTFLFVYISRANAHARHMGVLDAQKHMMAMGRRYVEVDGQKVLAQAPLAATGGSTTSVSSDIVPGSITAFKNVDEELTALISFITSTTANSLPPLDPAQPLEPGAVLDFDPSSPSAQADMELLQTEVHALYPLVLMGKMRDPWHREIKKMLAEYKITPSPLIVDVDQRRDHLLFIPLISRLLGTSELPQLLLKGKPLGSYHEILTLKDKGDLAKVLEASDALSVKPAKKKKKGVKEAIRLENEKILGPKPIIDSE